MSTLFLTLGDQLSHSLLQHADKERDVIFLCEVWDEATYVRHHPKKIALLFSCLLYTSPSPRDRQKSRMPSSA